MSDTLFVRTCQECGNRQPGIPGGSSAKCRKCKSDGLDYGSGGWVETPDGYVKSEDRIKELVGSVVRQVAELPDRNSPEDWPEAMIVTGAELEEIILNTLGEYL